MNKSLRKEMGNNGITNPPCHQAGHPPRKENMHISAHLASCNVMTLVRLYLGILVSSGVGLIIVKYVTQGGIIIL